MKTLVRNRVDTYMYVQNTTVEALKLPYWRQITHNLEHFFLSGAPFMDPEFFSEDQQVSWLTFLSAVSSDFKVGLTCVIHKSSSLD